jgi:transposase
MLRMDQVHVLRHKVLAEGLPLRQVARELGVSRNTVRKYRDTATVARVEPEPRPRPVLAAVQPRLDTLLAEWAPRTTKKQKLTGTRLWNQLRAEGCTVGTSLVRGYLREWRRQRAEVYVPLVHRPGDEAQIDFFEVTVEVAGVVGKAWMFLYRLMFSGTDFLWLYPRADQVCFLDGHARAVAAVGGVPARWLYDNANVAVRRIAGRERLLTAAFQALVTHYAVEPCFTRIGEGHDKGGVESRGKHVRWQHLVPIPMGPSLAAISERLNVELAATATTRTDAAGQSVTARFAVEQAHLRPAPAVAFEPRRVVSVAIRSTALAQVEGAHYSVPTGWARLDATAYVGVDTIEFVCRGARVTHPRQGFGTRSIRYRHYLPELAHKPQAVRQVAPELVAELGEPYGRFWALLVATHGARDGARILAQVLGVVVAHGEPAVRDALAATLASGRCDLLTLARLVAPLVAPVTGVVPPALAGYVIEAARAADYDRLLVGVAHE